MPEFSLVELPLWLYEWFGWFLINNLGLNEGLALLLQKGVAIFLLTNFVMLTPVFTIWIERKVAARFQDRLGPNRVGPWGLFQSFADVLKLVSKELIIPNGADKVVYMIAPVLAVLGIVTIWVVVPFMGGMVGADLNIAVIYIVAVSGLHTLALIIAGWSSNNKYALLGAFRTAAQLLSYEVPLLMGLLIPVLLAGSMSTVAIVEAQKVVPFLLVAPVGALIFFISAIAEIGRAPFDLLEGESEIVAGYQVEYGGMGFGMFMLAEFMHAFTLAAVFATLFLGGWAGPLVEQVPILGLGYFFIKTFLVYFVIMWLRSSLPRVRIDHMMGFNWKFMVPVVLVLVIGMTLIDKAAVTVMGDIGIGLRTVIQLVYNIIFLGGLYFILSSMGRAARAADNRERATWSYTSAQDFGARALTADDDDETMATAAAGAD